jgi:transcriptional regulator of met regulon
VSVHGKGDTVHDLPLNTPTIALVSSWLADRSKVGREGETALFVSSRGSRISIRAVQRLVERLRQKTGSAKHITPHTLRHSAATLALTLGTDLSTVADLLRHSDLNTTRRYLHLVDERRREAVRKLAVAIPPDIVASATLHAFGTDAAPGLDAEPPRPDAPRQSPVDSGATSSNVVPLPPRQKPVDAQYDLGGVATAA